MPRVTPGDVRVLLDTPITDLAIQFAIECANDTVESHIVGHPNQPSDPEKLTRIERFLAVHYAHPMDPSAGEVTLGDVRERFEGTSGIGLAETRAGRRAIELDPTNELEQVGKTEAIFQSFGADADDW